ncbi:Ppx/GppA phosphatase family protein [Thalassotalea ganghwensis]
MSAVTSHQLSPLYAVIDLGSNSFHMLITRQLADSVQVVDKVKRKVRLASGLDASNTLSEDAMARGFECLSFFAERLQDIPVTNIRIVATATLRLAKNRDEFIAKANKILGHNITLLSGIDEAKNIYLGVAHTSCSAQKKLVLDIGGASTELIIGDGFSICHAISLDMGCVTFTKQFFSQGKQSSSAFSAAISAAKTLLAPHVDKYKVLGWQSVLGGSGTMQALAEILSFERKPAIITPQFLVEMQQALINYQSIEKIDIGGLSDERIPVFASGLTILIAIFESLAIEKMQLSSGALREGLLYEMLPNSHQIKIRERTVNGLCEKFHIDLDHASRVRNQANYLHQSVSSNWQLNDDNHQQLLNTAATLHEIGLLVEFKRHQQHGAYLINNADMPGFEPEERQFIAMLVELYKGDIAPDLLEQLSIVDAQLASYYLCILRLAVILCRRRKDDVLPSYQVTIEQNNLRLCLAKQWLDHHPLIADELSQENQQLKKVGLSLSICSNH